MQEISYPRPNSLFSPLSIFTSYYKLKENNFMPNRKRQDYIVHRPSNKETKYDVNPSASGPLELPKKWTGPISCTHNPATVKRGHTECITQLIPTIGLTQIVCLTN